MLVAGTALVAALLTVEIDTGLADLGAGISFLGVLASFLNVVALVPADLTAAARGRAFDAASGAVAGLVCGVVLAMVVFLWHLPLIDVPVWYVLSGYVFPPVALAAVGAVTGLVAGGVSGRRRSLVNG